MAANLEETRRGSWMARPLNKGLAEADVKVYTGVSVSQTQIVLVFRAREHHEINAEPENSQTFVIQFLLAVRSTMLDKFCVTRSLPNSRRRV